MKNKTINFIVKNKISLGVYVVIIALCFGWWALANPGTTSIGENINVANDLTVNGTSTFTGTSTFSNNIIAPIPTADNHVATKQYVDSNGVSGIILLRCGGTWTEVGTLKSIEEPGQVFIDTSSNRWNIHSTYGYIIKNGSAYSPTCYNNPQYNGYYYKGSDFNTAKYYCQCIKGEHYISRATGADVDHAYSIDEDCVKHFWTGTMPLYSQICCSECDALRVEW